MVELVRDPLISITPYLASLNINPSSVFYQRVASRNVSDTNCEFTVSSPNKRSYLLSYAQIEWRLTHQNTSATFAGAAPNTAQTVGAAIAWGASRPLISFKPVLPMANSMSSITISLNGSTTTVSQPRRYQSVMNQLMVSKEEARSCFDGGAFYDDMGGLWDLNSPGVNPGAGGNVDLGLYKSQGEYANRLLRGVDPTAAGQNEFGNVANPAIVQVTEPIACPPFNEYALVKEGMPMWSHYAKMSDVIPNVDRLEVQIQMQKLLPSVIEQQYGLDATAATSKPIQVITAAQVSATLLLYWYEVPVSTEIPRSIDLNTWEVREFITPFGAQTGAFAVNGTPIANVASDLIQLNSVPSLFMIHIERDKNAGEYSATSLSADDDNAGGNDISGGIGGIFHSHDSFAEINTVQVLLGDRPNVVSASMSQRELYNLCQMNAKKLPYSFSDWKGQQKPALDTAALLVGAAWNQQASTGFVCFTPQQLAEKTSTGVFSANSVQFVVNGTPHDGWAGLAGGNQRWVMYIHVFYSKAFLRIESDKSSFQQQSLDESSARQLTDPPLGPAALGVGGSIGVGGSLPFRPALGSALSHIRSRIM